MTVNLAHKFDQGMAPREFMDGMQKNQEAFREGYAAFAWHAEADRLFFEGLRSRDDLRVLILAADWCGDVVRSVPVVFRALEAGGIHTEVLILEQHQDVMDHFLTMGGRSVPVVIFANSDGEVLGQWGPRPRHVQELMIRFKQDNPDREAADYEANIAVVRRQMAEKYEEGGGVNESVVSELRALISGL
ncbi:thioredoxin family protein [Paenibacillus macerans]|uniref:thioredoxin family protein n=1 Tax=Paenibacillus macerans TaxID=44252 RepID=UPI003D314554